MRHVELPLPELAVIAATRGLLGVGIGLLLAGRMTQRRRTLVGSMLFGVGALSTIPLGLDVLLRRRRRE